MFYLLRNPIVSLLLDLFTIGRASQRDKDLEILLLRQQLRILQRHHPPLPRVSRWAKFALAGLARKFIGCGHATQTKLDEVLLLFQPAPVLRWHRDLVRRQWTFTQRRQAGRPTTDPPVKALLLRLTQENPRWSYGKLQGQLLKLGRATIRDILKREQVPPAP